MKSYFNRILIFNTLILLMFGCSVEPEPNITTTSTTTTIAPTPDTTAPDVAILNPTNGQSVGASKIIEGTATDASGVASVFVTVNGTTNEITSLSGNNWNANFDFDTEGSTTVYAWGEDISNNVSDPVAVTFTVDYSTPEVAISSPYDGLLTNTTTIDITGTSSVHPNFNIASVEVSINGGAYSAATGTTDWTMSGVTLTEGTNTITALAISDTDKTNYTLETTVIADTAAPSIGVDQSEGSKVANDYTITGTISDITSGVSEIFVNLDGGSFSSASITEGTWSFDVSTTSGIHTNEYFAIDNANNYSATNLVWFNVIAFPTITIVSPTNNSITNDTSINISGTSSIDGFSIDTVEVSVNGGAFTSATGTTSWNKDVTLVNGANTIEVQAISSIDTTNSSSISVNVDSLAPALSLVSTQDDIEIGMRMATIRGTATDTTGVDTVYVSLDNSTYTAASLSGSDWNINFTDINGAQTVYYYATDNLGNVSATNSSAFTVEKFIWNVLVYLDADNNLETDGLDDFSEMEAVSELENHDVNVIVLIDRADGYSTADGDWTGTRLYQVNYESDTPTTTITSTRLGGMGLTTFGDSQELDMGDSATVESFVTWSSNTYDADNTFIIFWDHGDGWRNNFSTTWSGQEEAAGKWDNMIINYEPIIETYTLNKLTTEGTKSYQAPSPQVSSYKSVCHDEDSGNILNNADIHTALTSKNIDIIGFDACLMGMFECAYEFKDVANYMIASEETEPGYGWDYTTWLSDFCNTDMDAGDVVTNVVNAYASYYSTEQGCTLAGYDLTKVDSLFTTFETFTGNLSDYLWNASHENRSKSIKSTIENGTEQFYLFDLYGYSHVDVSDLAANFSGITGSSDVVTAVDNAVMHEWHHTGGTIFSGNPNAKGMALYYGNFASTNSGNIWFTTRTDYTSGDVIDFTADSAWDEFLYDLGSFPPFAWLGNGVSGSTNVTAINTGSDPYQFYIETPGNVTLNLTASDDTADALCLFDNQFNMITNVQPLVFGEDLEIVYDATNEGWFFTTYYRLGTNTGFQDTTIAVTGAGVK